MAPCKDIVHLAERIPSTTGDSGEQFGRLPTCPRDALGDLDDPQVFDVPTSMKSVEKKRMVTQSTSEGHFTGTGQSRNPPWLLRWRCRGLVSKRAVECERRKHSSEDGENSCGSHFYPALTLSGSAGEVPQFCAR
jgi:hypothetical protein